MLSFTCYLYTVLDKTDTSESTDMIEYQSELETFAVVSNDVDVFSGKLWETILFLLN